MWSIDVTRGSGSHAVFVQLADAIAADIRRGTLRAGDRLPSTRVLATQLGVTRNTVVAAFDELVAQGWVSSRGAGGTHVAVELPERKLAAEPRGIARRAAYELPAIEPLPTPLAYGARVHLSAGIPDPRLFPTLAYARAYRRALASKAGTLALGYGDPAGTPQLRTAIATMLRTTRGLAVGPENILITRGSQLAIELVARALLRRGDVAAVELLGYAPAWRAFANAGARIVGVPLDGAGLVVDQLPKRPRLVYVTPHHQYPTTVMLSPARRFALLERARRDRFAILEDDYDHEFHFAGRPIAPLASADPSGSVIYVGTLSKILAPGLRLGYIAAPEPVIAALAGIRAALDRQGDHVAELAVAELFEDGEIARHSQRSRRIYAARREAFADVVRRQLGDTLAFELAAGGVTIWARVIDKLAIDAWCARALARGVAVSAARTLALDGTPRPYIRLGFARYSEAEAAAALRTLAECR